MTLSGPASSLKQQSTSYNQAPEHPRSVSRANHLLACGLLAGSALLGAAEILAAEPPDATLAAPPIITLEDATGLSDPLGTQSSSGEHRDYGEYRDIEQQIDVGELRIAKTELESTIANLQRTGDRYDSALIEPLRLLGRVYHEQEDYPAAAETLALATQISRVTNGLHSPQQLSLVHQEISSLKAMGNIVEANRRHEYAFSIARRHYGRFGDELIPELLKVGGWYTSTGDVLGARARFSEARLLLSSKAGTADSEQMLFALRGIARSYRDEAFPPNFSRGDKETEELYARNGVGERQAGIRQDAGPRASLNSFHRGSAALIDIVRIEANRLAARQYDMLNATAGSRPTDQVLRTNAQRKVTTLNLEQLTPIIINPAEDKTALLTALLELADWYLLMDKESRAYAFYQQAYRLAEIDPNSDPVALLGEPALLYFPRPRDPRIPEAAPPESHKKGFVEISYDVDHRGLTKRVRTVTSHPRGLMEFRVRASARVARFRPSIIDGLPQPSLAQVYNHKFDYFPKNSGAVPPKVINTDASTSAKPIGSSE